MEIVEQAKQEQFIKKYNKRKEIQEQEHEALERKKRENVI